MTLGSLESDWTEMVGLASGNQEPIGYARVWAAALLRWLGDNTV